MRWQSRDMRIGMIVESMRQESRESKYKRDKRLRRTRDLRQETRDTRIAILDESMRQESRESKYNRETRDDRSEYETRDERK